MQKSFWSSLCLISIVGAGVAAPSTSWSQTGSASTPPASAANPPAAATSGPTAGKADNSSDGASGQSTQSTTKADTKGDATKLRDATLAYNAGVEALNKNDLAAAETNLEKAVQLTPEDASFNMLLGYVRLQRQNYDDAITSLEAADRNASTLSPKLQASLQNNLGIVYWKKGDFSKALIAYKKALAINKDDVDARYNLAFGLLSQKNYTAAIPHLLQLQSLNPQDKAFQTSVNDGLAEAYENTDELAKALGAHKKIVELNPKDATAHYNFALVLSRTGRAKDAINELNSAIRLDPKNAAALLLQGDLYTQQKQWPEAQEVLEQYVKLQPQQFAGWFNLGVAYDYAAKFDRALVAYAKAEELQPKDPAVKNNVGRILFKQKKFDEAIPKLQSALEIDPEFDDARINLALTLAGQEKWDDANAEWKKYIAKVNADLNSPDLKDEKRKAILNNRLATAYGAMAENYLKAKLYADAAYAYQQLLSRTPDNIDAMNNLGLSLYHIKHYMEAAKEYQAIIKKQPKNAIAHNNLGVVLEAMNKTSEAVDSYRRAVKLNPNYDEARRNLARLAAGTPA
jgi:superkiller protein 3